MAAIRKKNARTRYNPGAFLDLPAEASAYETARVVVLPLPYEESVSYGGGTAGGSDAIIAASQQVELYDPPTGTEPALEYGVHTLKTPAFFKKRHGKNHAARTMDAIGEEVARHLAAGKFVVGLGGEHTVSYGVAKGVEKALGEFSLVHIDAHADLRDAYGDNPYSHACVVRRIAEMPGCRKVMQLGIRSTTEEQVVYAGERGIRTWYAWDIHGKKEWQRQLGRMVAKERVFFTFDVDGLDPSIVPATGTPEPNGLTWGEMEDIVRIVADSSNVCAMDCVELAPVRGLHYADFAVARALYAIVSRFVQ